MNWNQLRRRFVYFSSPYLSYVPWPQRKKVFSQHTRTRWQTRTELREQRAKTSPVCGCCYTVPSGGWAQRLLFEWKKLFFTLLATENIPPGSWFHALMSCFLPVYEAAQNEIITSFICYKTFINWVNGKEFSSPFLGFATYVYSYQLWVTRCSINALAMGGSRGSPLWPRLVTVGFTRGSRGTVKLIEAWDFHCFIPSFIRFHVTRNGAELMRPGTACMHLDIFFGYVRICLYGRGAGFLPEWSSGFSSAWWTSSGPASPSACPRWEAAPPGSQLEGRNGGRHFKTKHWVT